MKKALFIIFILVVLTSCPAENEDFIDLFFNRDRKEPTMLSYDLVENKYFIALFDESVTVKDARLDKEEVFRESERKASIRLSFKEEIKAGLERILYFSAEDKSGNTSRYAIRLTGVNLKQADLLITEVSVKGTELSPDRIELTALSSGSTLGYAILDAIIGYESYRYYLPDISVMKNDIIVIYWDQCKSLPSTLIRDMEKTYYLYAKAPETLTSTNGAVILYNHTNGKGKVEDAFLYNTQDAEKNNGYGNQKSEESAKYLISIGEWSGKTFNSSQITSSRCAARYFPYEDSNTESDFYTTAARNSTFGYFNTNVKYEP